MMLLYIPLSLTYGTFSPENPPRVTKRPLISLEYGAQTAFGGIVWKGARPPLLMSVFWRDDEEGGGFSINE